MKAQTRFGAVWNWVSFFIIFGPIPPVALYVLSLPAERQSSWFIALAFCGFPLLILLIGFQMPWRSRSLIFESETLRLTRTKDGKELMIIDASRPYSGFLAIREGRTGKYGSTLIRWIQAKVEQDDYCILLEFLPAQIIRPAVKPWEDLPGPDACEILEPLLELDFAIDETALDRATGTPPSAHHGTPRFMEAAEGFDELMTFLRTNKKNNIWKREKKTAIDI